MTMVSKLFRSCNPINKRIIGGCTANICIFSHTYLLLASILCTLYMKFLKKGETLKSKI